MASLKVISFNADTSSEGNFNANGDYQSFVGKPIQGNLLGGFFARDVDVVALQEPVWALSVGGYYNSWNVHKHYHVYGSLDKNKKDEIVSKEVAVFVKKNSEWEVTSYYGRCYNHPGALGALDINATILAYQEPPRRAVIRKRLVVVQLRHRITSKQVTFVNYHGLNNGIKNDQNLYINERLVKSLVWMSATNDGWPAVLAADFNPPAVHELRATLENALIDRGCFYLPTLPAPDDIGVVNPECIDGFYVVPSRQAACISSRAVEMGAEILLPVVDSLLSFRAEDFCYVLRDAVDPATAAAADTSKDVSVPVKNAPKDKIHTHLAYKLDLLVATCGEVYTRFFPEVMLQGLQINDNAPAPPPQAAPAEA